MNSGVSGPAGRQVWAGTVGSPHNIQSALDPVDAAPRGVARSPQGWTDRAMASAITPAATSQL